MRTRRSLILFLAGVTQVTAAGCGNGGDLGTEPSSAIASVTVTPAASTIGVGGTVQLAGTPRDAAGHSLPYPVTWASSNTLVAKVSTTGLVTGMTTGQATITATSQTKTGSATITVTARLVVTGTGAGTVTASPPGTSGSIDCTIDGGSTSGTCSTFYASGTVVTLTATAAGMWEFMGWGGACDGTGSCQVTMTQDRTVSADFLGFGPPTQIAANSATGQTGIVGQPVAVPPSVVVRNANNQPVPNVPVTFRVTSGFGSISPEADVITDGNGIASLTQWILGATMGTDNNTVTAMVAWPYDLVMVGNEVIFKASAGPE